jgi:DNA polymerase-3 subunit gamma/tau
VLSRCQRFDLRRVESGVLVKHLEGIAKKEGIGTEPEALALIARAAEGSVRDSLSLLDQAIAHSAGSVRAEDVRNMLGLADRTRVIDLFEALMKGDMEKALAELRDQYDSGADPSVVLTDLAEFTHFVTRVKVVPAVTDDVALSEAERTRGRALATALSTRVLSRTWQMLLKGIAEVQAAGKPIAAAEMVLVRIAYAADLPTPDEAIRMIDANGGGEASAPRASGGNSNGGGARAISVGTMAVGAPATAPTTQRFGGGPRAALASVPQAAVIPAPQAPQALPTVVIDTFEQMVALATEKRDIQMKMALQRDVRLVRCEDGKLEIALEASASRTLVNDLSRKLQQWTGRPWVVIISREQGAPTLKAVAEAKQAELEVGVQSDPLVKAVLDKFPGAQIVGVRGQADAAAPLPAAVEALPPAEEDMPGDDEGFGDNWVRDEGND